MGGILDRPRHKIIIQNRKPDGVGSLGQTTLVDDGEPFAFRCNIHPLQADEILSRGLQEEVTRRCVARTWPASVSSLLYLDGYEWEQDGEAEDHNMSRATQNVNVVIKRRGRHDAPSLQEGRN